MKPAPWRVIASTPVLRDRWISLRADECVTSEGTVIAPFYVLQYPDWVKIVAIDDGERVLLVEQYRHGLGLMSLEVPSRAIEARDASPLAAAQRELREETGYVADDWHPIVSLAANPANQTNRCHVFLARMARLRSIPDDDPRERLSLRPMPIADVVAAARSGDICQSMHVAALALSLSAIGAWHA